MLIYLFIFLLLKPSASISIIIILLWLFHGMVISHFVNQDILESLNFGYLENIDWFTHLCQ